LNTLFDVKESVLSLMGEENSGTANDGYLVPKINFTYKAQNLYIKRSTGSNLEQVVEIPNALDANNNPTNQGLSSLANQQQKGGLLFGLYEPLYMWWKPAGAPERAYVECYEKKTLPFSTPLIYSPTQQMYFTWRGNQLFVTPISAPIDLLVDGRFNPPPLVKNEDVLVVDPDMEVPLTSGTIAVIQAFDRGNIPTFEAAIGLAGPQCDDIVAKLILQKQGYTARAGSNARRGRRGWFWA
jgi:hypothetical protein